MPSKTKPAEVSVHSTPRERFQSSTANLKAHQDLVDLDAFDRGTDAALVDLFMELGKNVKDEKTAAEAGYMLKGAEAYLRRLKTFAEVSAPYVQPETYGELRSTDQPRRI
jgi:hypothetical protein